ncbi:MAG: hypothetical protein FJ087_20380, partial [Deltaproteobacteria bacterium]|nr:hypothetical protein [Deltaproteobacteria bacterium]
MRLALVIAATLALLAACSQGSGGGTAPDPDVPVAPDPSAEGRDLPDEEWSPPEDATDTETGVDK